MNEPCKQGYCQYAMEVGAYPGASCVPGKCMMVSRTTEALDFDSDEPLPVCPMRNNGDDICESCQ